MKLHWKFLVIPCLLAGACPAALVLSGNAAVKPLEGPYGLRLTLDRTSGFAGETVNATIEFKNTGKRVLWIPRRKEIFFGFETTNTESGSGSSACEGLQFVKVKPGKVVRYEKDFVVPGIEGDVRVFITVDRKVSAPLVVKRLSPQQVSGLAPDQNPGAARP